MHTAAEIKIEPLPPVSVAEPGHSVAKSMCCNARHVPQHMRLMTNVSDLSALLHKAAAVEEEGKIMALRRRRLTAQSALTPSRRNRSPSGVPPKTERYTPSRTRRVCPTGVVHSRNHLTRTDNTDTEGKKRAPAQVEKPTKGSMHLKKPKN